MAEFNLWLLIVGLVVGAVFSWLVIGTMSRDDEDAAAGERAAEAAWVARVIEEHGGHAPTELVEQVLLLHRRYLAGRAATPLSTSDMGPNDRAADATRPAAAEPRAWAAEPRAREAPEAAEEPTDEPIDAPGR